MRIIIKKIIAVCLLMLLPAALLASCDTGTRLEFSFTSRSPANSTEEKPIYINTAMEKLELNAELTAEQGSIRVFVFDTKDYSVVWRDEFEESCEFVIELTDIEAESEYLIQVQFLHAKAVNLTITSPEKLVRNE